MKRCDKKEKSMLLNIDIHSRIEFNGNTKMLKSTFTIKNIFSDILK